MNARRGGRKRTVGREKEKNCSREKENELQVGEEGNELLEGRNYHRRIRK